MIPRRIALRPDMLTSEGALPCWPPAQSARVGWTRKAAAVAMHLACLALFGLIVVWPVASPIASGELGREFQPVLQALAAWAPFGRSP